MKIECGIVKSSEIWIKHIYKNSRLNESYTSYEPYCIPFGLKRKIYAYRIHCTVHTYDIACVYRLPLIKWNVTWWTVGVTLIRISFKLMINSQLRLYTLCSEGKNFTLAYIQEFSFLLKSNIEQTMIK